MDELPPELQGLAPLLDSQPAQVRDIFAYCLCLMMVETKRMRLVRTIPGEVSPICIFETTGGEAFGVPQPPLNEKEEAQVIAVLRDILKDEDLID